MFPSAEREIPSSGVVTATLITAGALCPGKAGPCSSAALGFGETLPALLGLPLFPLAFSDLVQGGLQAKSTEMVGRGERRSTSVSDFRGQNGCWVGLDFFFISFLG